MNRKEVVRAIAAAAWRAGDARTLNNYQRFIIVTCRNSLEEKQ